MEQRKKKTWEVKQKNSSVNHSSRGVKSIHEYLTIRFVHRPRKSDSIETESNRLANFSGFLALSLILCILISLFALSGVYRFPATTERILLDNHEGVELWLDQRNSRGRCGGSRRTKERERERERRRETEREGGNEKFKIKSTYKLGVSSANQVSLKAASPNIKKNSSNSILWTVGNRIVLNFSNKKTFFFFVYNVLLS